MLRDHTNAGEKTFSDLHLQRIRVIDSHTGGEPTRLVIAGGPDLGNGSMSERRERFRSQYDCFRSAVVSEHRGSDVVVGALLCDPVDRASAAGVIFFNNVGYLGMCGHGTIGVAVALRLDGHSRFFNYGLADRRSPITSDLVFNLGSVGKVFDTTLMARSEERRVGKEC